MTDLAAAASTHLLIWSDRDQYFDSVHTYRGKDREWVTPIN